MEVVYAVFFLGLGIGIFLTASFYKIKKFPKLLVFTNDLAYAKLLVTIAPSGMKTVILEEGEKLTTLKKFGTVLDYDLVIVVGATNKQLYLSSAKGFKHEKLT